jgi:hypothetical protein
MQHAGPKSCSACLVDFLEEHFWGQIPFPSTQIVANEFGIQRGIVAVRGVSG